MLKAHADLLEIPYATKVLDDIKSADINRDGQVDNAEATRYLKEKLKPAFVEMLD